MFFNFNIIDESVDDVLATKEQIMAAINYDTSEEFDIGLINWITIISWPA